MPVIITPDGIVRYEPSPQPPATRHRVAEYYRAKLVDGVARLGSIYDSLPPRRAGVWLASRRSDQDTLTEDWKCIGADVNKALDALVHRSRELTEKLAEIDAEVDAEVRSRIRRVTMEKMLEKVRQFLESSKAIKACAAGRESESDASKSRVIK